jgi:uncharacterized protein (TIGR00661 family)
MRIAYGVFGYGRGHASRALAVLPSLLRRHEVLLLAGGDAYDTLSSVYQAVPIPTLRYVYAGARLSRWRTIRQSFPHLRDLFLGGDGLRSVIHSLREWRPDVAISDSDPWTHRAAALLRIPRISFDHFGILAYCRLSAPWHLRLGLVRDTFVYRLLSGRPDRVVVSSFYDAPSAHSGVCCVGPLLRAEVLAVRPSRGEHLLLYLNQGAHQLTLRWRTVLQGLEIPVIAYGMGRSGVEGNIVYRPFDNARFVEDLATCRAVLSTAGNQLVGEVMHLRKPILVVPEESNEQWVNADAVVRLGIGARVALEELDETAVRTFLAREREFAEQMRHLVRDGTAEAIEALERFCAELAGMPAASAPVLPRAA